MHIDTDEANAAGINFCSEGELIQNETRPESSVIAGSLRRKQRHS
jgi:hypothetical protein